MAELGGSRMNNESLHRIATLVGFLLGIDPVQVHNHKRRKHEAHTALLLPAWPRFRNLPAGPLLCAALPFTLTCVCRARRRRLSHNSQTLSLSLFLDPPWRLNAKASSNQLDKNTPRSGCTLHHCTTETFA
uniref:(northern house mosquito) hypothetical protein n=1 Tax=Culex pipiens TaxID=7175 RepID=A0A8D8FPM5_CULPI